MQFYDVIAISSVQNTTTYVQDGQLDNISNNEWYLYVYSVESLHIYILERKSSWTVCYTVLTCMAKINMQFFTGSLLKLQVHYYACML